MTRLQEGPPATVDPQAPLEHPAGQPAERRRSRLGSHSLTLRLVAGVVVLVIVLVGAIGAATYYSLSSFLDGRFEQQLTTASTQNAGFFENCLSRGQQIRPGVLGCQTGPPPTEKEWVAAFVPSTNVRIEFQSEGLLPLHLNDDQVQRIADDPYTRFTTQQDGQQIEVVARQTNSGAVIVTGLSTREVSRTLGRLVAVEVVIGLAAVALALVATGFGVQRSLRNLYRVTGTAREVATELSPEGAGLDRRVPEDEPDTEVGQLATSFNTMLAAVETQFAARLESEHRLRQFLADASHELRTPLTSIRGYAELARMQRAAGDVTSDDNLDRIESEGTRMSRLVEDLLLLARGDAAASDGVNPAGVQEVVDVPDLLDDVVSGSRAAFPDRPIELRLDAVPEIIGDRDQLLRAIRNLVTNAAVHTEAGRPIVVHGFAQGGGLVVTIVDGGPGLPPEQAAHVFERFWRADKARSRASGGSGLGMSIVATIVRAHGGSVRFESTVEGGSTVTLWLPAAP